MNDAPSFEPIPPEDEALPVGKIVIAAACAVAIFTVAVAIAWWMSLAGTPSSIPHFSAEVGNVDQRPFALETTAQQLQLDQRQRLSSYGWVDRTRNTIHIPIDVAIERLVAGQREAAR